jgi:predicted Rossmann fold nucleotide-binding protein DprA/Smf involved in DNA uptake
MKITTYGNTEILKLHKTAFLASGTIPPDMVLRCYDWATDMRDEGECVISGFNSKLEQDVLHFLLKGNQPIILVLARKMYRNLSAELQTAIDSNRLLIISTSGTPRQSRQTAFARNEYIAELCDKICFVGVTEKSSLYPLTQRYSSKIINP